jgi:hypothetical protein
MTTSAFSIILSVLVLQFHLRGDAIMAKWLRVLFFDCLARVLFMQHSTQTKTKRSENSAGSFFENRRTSSFDVNTNDQNGVQLASVTRSLSSTRNAASDVHLSALNKTIRSSSEDPENVELYLSKILDSMNEYFRFKNDLARKKDLGEEWKELARIMDRLFMVIYVIINIVAAVVFFGLFYKE